MSARSTRHLSNHLGDCANDVCKAMESEEFRDALQPGESCSVTRDNGVYKVVTTVTRRLHQENLPFSEPKAKPSSPAAPSPPDASQLKEMHHKLRARATAEPQTGKKLARDAGYTWNRHARAALALLVKLELLHRPHKGLYTLPPADRSA